MVIENLRREEKLDGSSDRGFGLVFAIAFAAIGLWPLFMGNAVRSWSLATATVFLILAVGCPSSLKKLNKAWMRVGLLLNHIVSPIALGIIFFSTVLPIGLLMRLMGKDVLRLKFDSKAETYWIDRTPPGPDPKTMNNQF